MKKFYPLLVAIAIITSRTGNLLNAQCPGGYTQTQANWDNLEYYWNSGLNVAPYGYNASGAKTYVTNAQEQTQHFALGTNRFSIVTSAAGIVKGENALHTGDIAGYTGQDAQFTPSANGQTAVITFADPVLNASFTLYGVDRNAVVTVSATNSAAAPTPVTATPQGATILTVAGTPAVTISDLTNTTLANTDNRGTVTISVPGTALLPVKSITITFTTIGGNTPVWLSDIFACVTGTFPTNYHQGLNNQPFTGPTQNQPDYFIVTPDNNSVYMMDPATARCYFLFTDASKTYVNSFAYDAVNKYLYYVSEASALDRNNKALKRYNFNTSTISTVLADITTLGFPTFNAGVESAAAAFYNGQLYFGVEGGQYSAGNTRESMIWRIDFDASQVPISACQVYSTNSYDNLGNIIHDWADIIIKDGVLINYNSAKVSASNFTNSSYTHIDMMTTATTRYNNPLPGTKYSGQAALNWAGNTYMIYDSLWTYSAGVISGKIKMTVVNPPGEPVGPVWVGNTGDGSEPFRPKCDLGDAPATYDPNPVSPAVHERSELIRLGATWDKEWIKRGVTGSDDTDDGIGTVTIMSPGGGGYVAQVSAFNNSGSNATLIAWLDYNGNGVFDASEANTPITVPSSASAQNFWLAWTSTPNTFVNGQYTYLRVRITGASAGMTTAHSTGYFTNGEVEDYRVLVDNFPLATKLLTFDAKRQDKSVNLEWKSAEETGIYAYVVERSRDNNNWEAIDTTTARNENGVFNYSLTDQHPLPGQSFYRLRLVESTGMNRFSAVKSVSFKMIPADILIAPIPAKDHVVLSFNAVISGEVNLTLLNMQGRTIHATKQMVSAGANQLTLQFPEGITSGTYMVRMESGGEVMIKKIIVSK
jgi:GEVED domain/Secretion system C-terminal sorting domain